jgi:hypothetical protein
VILRLISIVALGLALAISPALPNLLLLGGGSAGGGGFGPSANCYWVGGTGNWTDTTKWSNASGGTGGTCIGNGGLPDGNDTAFLDGSSGGGTITLNTDISVSSINSGAHTGTFNATGRTITLGSWSGTGTSTRTINLTNATVNVTGSAWLFTTVTGLTFTSTGSTININGSGARTLNFGAIGYGTVNVTGSGVVTSGNQNATFVNLSIVKGDSMIVGNWTISGTLTATGPSQSARLLVHSSAIGTQRTMTAASRAVSNTDFLNITMAGAALTGTSIGDAGGNTNITFTTPVTRYLVNAGGKSYSDVTAYSASSGGATGATMPLPQDTLIADTNSFSGGGQTFTVDVSRIGAQDWSTVTNTPTLAFTNNYFMHGSFNVPFGTGAVACAGNFTGTISVQTGTMMLNIHLPAISAVGGQTILDHGFTGNVTVQSPGGTVSLGSHFLSQATFTHNAGTLVTNNFDMQATHFASAGTATRVLTLGSSRMLSSSNSGTGQAIFSFTNTGVTVTANTARLETFSGSSSVRIVNLAGLSFGAWLDWYHDNLFNSAEVQINGGATFAGAFTVDPSNLARNYTFQTGLTVTVGSLVAAGQGTGSRLTLRSSTATPFTFSDSAGTNTCNFCTITNSTGSGGATWNATNSTGTGTNNGWNITP